MRLRWLTFTRENNINGQWSVMSGHLKATLQRRC